MTASNRYLHFHTIELDEPYIQASCSQCGHKFGAESKPGESFEDLLKQVRAQFNEHKCEGSSA
jgi:hypothetical protein